MDINSLQGASAYINASSSVPSVDNAQLRDQNLEASRTDLNAESISAAQKAFEVTITREAQDRQAAETTNAAEETQTAASESQNTQASAAVQKTSQIVNIVA